MFFIRSFIKTINLSIIIRCLLILVAFSIILHLSLKPVVGLDTDLFWHLASGQDMWHLKNACLTDSFSHTRFGYKCLNYSWGFELILYFLYSLGGLNSIILFRSFLFLFPMACLIYTARLRGAGLFPSLLIAVWSCVILSSYWWIRPQLASLCMGSLFLLIVELVHHGKDKFIWLFPVLLILWTNLHGGVAIIGLSIIIVYSFINILQKRQKYCIVVMFLCVLSIFVTPRPIATPYFIISSALFPNSFRNVMVEFQKPDFLLPDYRIVLFFMIFVLLSAIFMISQKRFFDISIVIVFTPLIFAAQRYHFLLLPFFVPTVSVAVEALIKRLLSLNLLNRKFFNSYSVSIKIIFIMFLSVLLLRESFMIFRLSCPPSRLIRWETFPDGSCNFLIANKIKGNLFNSLNSAGYIIWKLKNQCYVYIDARNDILYDESLLEEYFYILYGNENTLSILDNHKINIIIQSKEYDNFPVFTNILPASKEWFLAYEDLTDRVYLRKSRFYNMSKTFVGLNKSFMPHLFEGKKLIDKGMTDAGILELEKSQALYPDCPRCQLWLGTAYARNGDYISAIRQWKLMLLLHYPVAIRGVYYNMGLMELNMGNTEKAACYLYEELKEDPDNKEIKELISRLPRHDHRLCFLKFAWNRFWAPFFVW